MSDEAKVTDEVKGQTETFASFEENGLNDISVAKAEAEEAASEKVRNENE